MMCGFIYGFLWQSTPSYRPQKWLLLLLSRWWWATRSWKKSLQSNSTLPHRQCFIVKRSKSYTLRLEIASCENTQHWINTLTQTYILAGLSEMKTNENSFRWANNFGFSFLHFCTVGQSSLPMENVFQRFSET